MPDLSCAGSLLPRRRLPQRCRAARCLAARNERRQGPRWRRRQCIGVESDVGGKTAESGAVPCHSLSLARRRRRSRGRRLVLLLWGALGSRERRRCCNRDQEEAGGEGGARIDARAVVAGGENDARADGDEDDEPAASSTSTSAATEGRRDHPGAQARRPPPTPRGQARLRPRHGGIRSSSGSIGIPLCGLATPSPAGGDRGPPRSRPARALGPRLRGRAPCLGLGVRLDFCAGAAAERRRRRRCCRLPTAPAALSRCPAPAARAARGAGGRRAGALRRPRARLRCPLLHREGARGPRLEVRRAARRRGALQGRGARRESGRGRRRRRRRRRRGARGRTRPGPLLDRRDARLWRRGLFVEPRRAPARGPPRRALHQARHARLRPDRAALEAGPGALLAGLQREAGAGGHGPRAGEGRRRRRRRRRRRGRRPLGADRSEC